MMHVPEKFKTPPPKIYLQADGSVPWWWPQINMFREIGTAIYYNGTPSKKDEEIKLFVAEMSLPKGETDPKKWADYLDGCNEEGWTGAVGTMLETYPFLTHTSLMKYEWKSKGQ